MPLAERTSLSVDKRKPLDWRLNEEEIFEHFDRDDLLYMFLNADGEKLEELAGSIYHKGHEMAHNSIIDARNKVTELKGDNELMRVREFLSGDHEVRRAIPQDKYEGGELPAETYPAPLSQRDIVAEVEGIDLDAMYHAATRLQEEYEEMVIDADFQRDEEDWGYSRSISMNLPHGEGVATRFSVHEDDDIYVIGGGTASTGKLFEILEETPLGKVFTKKGDASKRLQLFRNYQEQLNNAHN